MSLLSLVGNVPGIRQERRSVAAPGQEIPPMAKSPASSGVKTEVMSLGKVMKSSRARAWIPPHLIESLPIRT